MNAEDRSPDRAGNLRSFFLDARAAGRTRTARSHHGTQGRGGQVGVVTHETGRSVNNENSYRKLQNVAVNSLAKCAREVSAVACRTSSAPQCHRSPRDPKFLVSTPAPPRREGFYATDPRDTAPAPAATQRHISETLSEQPTDGGPHEEQRGVVDADQIFAALELGWRDDGEGCARSGDQA